MIRKMLARSARQIAFLQGNLALLGREARLRIPDRRTRWRMYVDYLIAVPAHGQSVNDYFAYEFATKSHSQRRQFVTAARAKRILAYFNDPEAAYVLQHKARFYQAFGDLMGREVFDPIRQSEEELARFLAAHTQVVIKPLGGAFGRGVRFLTAEERESPERLYRELRRDRAIAEEALVQHPAMAELHPHSVNTLRITTVRSGGVVHVMSTALRMGSGGQRVDNLKAGGIAVSVDSQTGRISSTGVDRMGLRYSHHPSTGVELLGRAIPSWPDVLGLARAAAERVPSVRYVGWDIAVARDGRPVLIEGNDCGNFGVQQQPDQVGKWPLYRALMTQ